MSARDPGMEARTPETAFGALAAVAGAALVKLGRGLDEAVEIHDTWILALEARVDVLGRMCSALERDVLRLRADSGKRPRAFPGRQRRRKNKETKK